MPNVTELRERQDTILTEARERLDQISAATDESRARELEAAHDTAMAEYDRLTGVIKRQEQLDAMEARAQETRAQRRPTLGDAEARGAGAGAGNGEVEQSQTEYRNAFAKIVSGIAPSDLEPEERAALKTGVTKFEQRTQTAGTASAGGYTVPVTLATFIDRAMKDWGPMYDSDICTVLTTTGGGQMGIPTIDDTAKSAGAHTEGAALTDDGSEDVVFGKKVLDAYAYDTEFIKWSWELDMDGIFNMEVLLGGLIGERCGRIGNTKLTVGSGTNEPNGIVTASGLGVTAASASAITFDEVIDLEHSVNQAYRRSPKARYMLSDTTFKAVRKLKDGQGNYLWQRGDVKNGAPPLLNNYPYSINDDMAGIATGNKAMLFGDFGRYYVRKVGGTVIGVLRERFWPDMGIAGLIRFDGEIGQAGAIKHLKLA